MKFTLKRLIFIIILTSITKISLCHEFWIDPKNYHLLNIFHNTLNYPPHRNRLFYTNFPLLLEYFTV